MLMPEIVTRKGAKARGLARYFTGKPCSRGHMAERSAAAGTCLACHAETQKQRRDADPAGTSEIKRKSRAKHAEKVKEYRKSYGEKNRDTVAMRFRRYWEANKAREQERCRRYQAKNLPSVREQQREWRAENRHKVRAKGALRAAAKIRATPPWLSDAHKAQIEAIYHERERVSTETGVLHHVDHIIPLRSHIVCGLHVPWNLQVIPANDNLRKSNKITA